MQIAERIAEKVREAGGRTFYVGGFVRDRLIGIENKDVDIEIHGILPETLMQMMREAGFSGTRRRGRLSYACSSSPFESRGTVLFDSAQRRMSQRGPSLLTSTHNIHLLFPAI